MVFSRQEYWSGLPFPARTQYGVGQKVHSDFSVRCNEKTQINLLARRIQCDEKKNQNKKKTKGMENVLLGHLHQLLREPWLDSGGGAFVLTVYRLDINWTIQNILLIETLMVPAGKTAEESLGTWESITVPWACPNWPHISGFKQDSWQG